MNTSDFLEELATHFGKKITFDMTQKIKPFEMKHLKTIKSSVTKQDPKDKNIISMYSFRVIELDDEVIIRDIIEDKIIKQ